MITQLYTFSPGSYVVADEWNANFNVLQKTNIMHFEAINDAYAVLAFPDNDLSQLYAAVRNQPNSFNISGVSVNVTPQCEYYKELPSGDNLAITIPNNFNSEARIVIKTNNDRTLLPFSVSYSGTTHISYGEDNVFPAGIYFIMIYECNGIAQVKLIWTGA